MTRRRLAVGAGALVAVAAIVAAVIWFGPFGDSDDAPSDAVDRDDPATAAALAFADHWQAGTLDRAPVVPGATTPVPETVAFVTAGLGTSAPGPDVEVTRVDTSEGAGDRAMAQATVSWDLGGDRTWTYPTTIPLVRQDDRWLVEWTPKVIHPTLAAGELLQATRTPGRRGRVLALDGSVLVGAPGQVVIGIRKARTKDLAATTQAVATLTGVDPAELAADLDAAGPEDFVEVTRMERTDYDQIRDQIHPVPGTVFQTAEVEAAVPPQFARAVLGSIGPATEEIAAASDGTIAVGDHTGLSGLALSQNEVLAGTPGVAVLAGAPDGPKRTLQAFPGTDGRDLTVTLDARTQTVAEAVVAQTAQPSAVVVIRASTGDVLAVANGPTGSSAYNRALLGRYAPGSVFKIASTWALLGQGLTPDAVVDCPATINAGKAFKNAGGFELGSVPFRTDFARSCNTAFVAMAGRIDGAQLAAAASELGYRPLDLGIPAFGASVPTDGDATEHAAQMIGQGRVEGNVANVALMSASVANGSSVVPRLIVDPDQPDPAVGDPLPADRVTILRDLMRAVVTEGTGEALRDVPGAPVHAKTGTAEFGTEDPPQTHAWITGFQGDLAFAVVVEGGGGGGAVAGPIAADLLRRLAGP